MKFFSSSSFFGIAVLLQAALWWVVKDDPFFGDAIASTSKAALAIYDSGFHTLFYPEAIDPGHPTLFPVVMALCWKIAGLHLWVSHLLSSCCALLLLWSLRKCCLLFVSLPVANIILLLSCCFSTYLSMSAMMLNTTLLMALCLLAIHALVSQQKWVFIGVTSIMMLTHLQAAYFLTALVVADCWIGVGINNQTFIQWIRASWLKYLFPAGVFLAWLVLHYLHTGWVLHSPNYSDAQSLKGPVTFLKGLALISWRLVDYGMLPVYCVTAVALWRNKTDRKLKIVFGVMLMVTSLIMAITLEHTIGHRYFLVFQLLCISIAVGYLAQFPPKYFAAGVGLLLMSLVAGNFLYYPGKTLGDATLAYRNYFKIEQHIREEASKGDSIFSYAPIANPSRSRYLTEEGLLLLRITSDSLNTYPVILQSNVNAEFTTEQRKYLETNWYGKSYEEGAVYVNIFLNPSSYQKPEGWTLREPSWLEQQINALKNASGR